MTIEIIIGAILVIMLGLVLFKLFAGKSTEDQGSVGALQSRMDDIKSQVNELSTKQITFQAESMHRQAELFSGTQKTLNEQLSSIMAMVNKNLRETQENINTQLTGTGKTFSEMQNKIGIIEEAARSMSEFQKSVKSLQDTLQAPKLRGNLGEYLLEDLLKQILPADNYRIKHSFKDGTQVDGAIVLADGIVPVDAKFPLESFQRILSAENEPDRKKAKKEFVNTVKARIDEIAGYIKPDEKTFDFALMYIPAENVYYEIVIKDTASEDPYEIFNYAIEKHVIPVSPNSIYSYLMAIAHGLKGLKIEQQAKMIMGELSKLQGQFLDFSKSYSQVGTHIRNAEKKYGETYKKLDKLNDNVGNITGSKTELIEEEESGR